MGGIDEKAHLGLLHLHFSSAFNVVDCKCHDARSRENVGQPCPGGSIPWVVDADGHHCRMGGIGSAGGGPHLDAVGSRLHFVEGDNV